MTVRIVHVSDIHFGCENAAALRAAHDFIADDPPDLLATTGDITQAGYPREFAAAKAWIQTLPCPHVSTPGNHDTPYWNVIGRLGWAFKAYGQAIGPDCFETVDLPGLKSVAFNTARGVQPRINWSKGQARREDALEVCRRLGGGEALKVAICHHPLMEVTGGPMTGRVWGGEQASRILAEGGADLILTGHVHMPFAHPLPFADQRTYAVGASTLSMRERGCPAGFNVIEADDACIRITALGWVNGHFEPQRSWGFDRRERAGGAAAPSAGKARTAA
jgi:3',5'-cyclic AMP phosphodiesterase CpdA